jgi:putative methionine-R-sulfoxide reductase with GAF domain
MLLDNDKINETRAQDVTSVWINSAETRLSGEFPTRNFLHFEETREKHESFVKENSLALANYEFLPRLIMTSQKRVNFVLVEIHGNLLHDPNQSKVHLSHYRFASTVCRVTE